MVNTTNFGIATLNDAPCGDTATIAITGMGRSGTTMIARIVQNIGLPMGDALSSQFLEDAAILAALKEGRIGQFSELCRTRDAQDPVWAFKCPALRIRLLKCHRVMRNPRYIVPFRDILAISERNRLALGIDLAEALASATRNYVKFVAVLQTIDTPILAISYEKALQYPEKTVRAVAAFCGVPLTPERVADIAAHAIHNGDPRYLTP